MMPLLCDEKGYFKLILSQKELAKLQEIVSYYGNTANQWWQQEGIISCAQKIVDNGGLYNSLCASKIDPQLKAIIDRYPALKDLLQVQELCAAQKFEQAHALLAAHDGNGYSIHRHWYQSEFLQKHTQQGIDKTFLHDPYLEKLGLLPDTWLPSPHNGALAQRHALHQEFAKNVT